VTTYYQKSNGLKSLFMLKVLTTQETNLISMVFSKEDLQTN
jgi:hypothetical protein